MATGQSSFFAFATGFQLISTLLPCLLLLAGVDAQNRSDEVRTLLSFRDVIRQSFGPDQTKDYSNTWNESDFNPCAWAVVTCTANYTVEELDLSDWGIVGDQDLAVLSTLADLRKLDLSSNELFAFPQNLSTLTGLTWLDMSRNWINDTIPVEISTCRNLRVIALEQNFVYGEIPSLLVLVNLQLLLLDNNYLSGSFPKALGELSKLVSIDLSNNDFSGSIPSLAKLTDLVELTLDSNNFTEFEEPLSLSAKSLSYLSVSFNQLGGIITSSIGTLSNLLYLDMSHNLLSGKIPLEFSQLMKHINLLDLSQNQLTGGIPLSMLQTSEENMLSLNLSYNRLSGSVPIDGTKNHLFIYVDLSYNKLNGTLSLNLFSSNNSVFRVFALQNNYIHGHIMDVLDGPGLTNTLMLQLQNNLFTGDLSRAANTSLGNVLLVDLSHNNLRWTTFAAFPDPIRDTLASLTGDLWEF